jgi:hydroxypyruvate isomerase
MNRREFLPAAGIVAATFQSARAQDGKQLKGRLNQSVCRWCYNGIPIDDLARESARLGLKSMDLVEAKDWPAVKKHGLTLTVVPGGSTIPDGYNRKELHDGLVERAKDVITAAAKEKIPSVIVFSGNRRGMSHEEGLENCMIGLNRIKGYAEDKGILVCMELLNSKVNHKDYMCDHTAWGVELMKRVNSPNVKLLYDIYHMQIMEGDVIRTIRDNYQYIGHFHTGGVPGRNEIDGTQELNYEAIVKAILDLGYKGYFAHEFIPKREPLKSLGEAVALCDV